MSMFTEFRDFALRGNVVDMAVGVVIGGAFGKIVTSLVDNVIMPPIGAIVGKVDFSDLALPLIRPNPVTNSAGVVVKYGAFLTTVIQFTIIAFVIFMLIKAMNAVFKRKEATPPPPSKQELLLMEIRDLLKAQAKTA